uniref:Uncharacterized protein n=1 Tax=Arion vulgaris TaxID=1028688 RepID=A0A0B6YYG6_9EUPU
MSNHPVCMIQNMENNNCQKRCFLRTCTPQSAEKFIIIHQSLPCPRSHKTEATIVT